MIRTFIRSAIERLPNLAQFLRNFRDLLDRRNPSKLTPWGFTLAGHVSMADGTFEPDETKVVRALLQQADVFVNVGANVGYYCCHALSLGKCVIAVEPIVRNVHYLLKNLRDNGWANQAEVFPVALGHRTDILEIWGGGTGASLIKGWASIPDSHVTQVPVLSLDRILGNMLDGKRGLILVDIEGAELMMLQGAKETLDKDPHPIWMVEITTTEHQPAGTALNPSFLQTFEMFFSRGYRAFTADESAQEITRSTIRQVVAGQQRLNIHNFVFR